MKKIFVRDYRLDLGVAPRARVCEGEALFAAPWNSSAGEVLFEHAPLVLNPRGRFRVLDLIGGVRKAGDDEVVYLWRARLEPDEFVYAPYNARRLLWGIEGIRTDARGLVRRLREVGRDFERGARRPDLEKLLGDLQAEQALLELAGALNPTALSHWAEACAYLEGLRDGIGGAYAGGRMKVARRQLKKYGRLWA